MPTIDAANGRQSEDDDRIRRGIRPEGVIDREGQGPRTDENRADSQYDEPGRDGERRELRSGGGPGDGE